MYIRRVPALCIALIFMGASLTLSAQRDKKDEKRSKQEQQDIEALVKLVDAVSMGQQQPPADLALTWEQNHFVKGQDGRTYVPFTVTVDPTKLSAPGVAMYVRVMNKQAAATPTATAGAKNERDRDRDKKNAKVEYPWDNVHFLEVRPEGAGPSRISRAMAVPGGEYEIFIAMKEKNTGQRNQPPAKVGLLRKDLTVPDFNAPELATSSVILAQNVEPVQTAMTSEQQQENPYTFGTMRIVPAFDPKFKKSGELQVIFWIYGVSTDATKKPDVTVEYNFHQKLAEGEKYFNKTAPQQLNAETLPPQFDLAAGHQLPGSLVVPLTSFPEGSYRLEIKVTDKPSGKTLTKNVDFAVIA
jgi:hypothetical protein